MHLDFATLDPHDPATGEQEHPAGQGRTRLRAFADAVSRGFHDAPLGDEPYARWLRATVADAPRLSGAWVPQGEYGAGPAPVATFTSFAGELSTGGAPLPLHMVTDVTVSPAHRRQGVLRRLMTEDLQHAVEQGRPLAGLTVSEGAIYGRFGFGVATWRADVEVDVSSRFALPGQERYGRLEVLDPADLWPLSRDLFEAWHRTARGSVSRPALYEAMSRGEWNWEDQQPDPRLRGAVHLDADGTPDGYVLYRHQGWDRPRTVRVQDLVGLTPRAELALWRFLADIDLTEVVRATTSPDDPLTWALADPQTRRVTGVRDHIWLRVLDVPRCLEARPWYGDGEVVLDVADPLGHATGRWRVAVRDGAATVSAVGGSGDGSEVRTDVSTLSALYLGGVGVGTLVAAGRITGDPGALASWARMADGGPTPWSRTSF
ncbi:GNAT family N-acetyltransferase [Nocardioides solisilvae]|uniref:GNAT family N-acetyltransferase n=1 Tax=Nocardioides solisilvae TaxID=1542435 RepID=UPI0013A53B77|nr:GNAT family N-acetyltransferase [Nocardioides solisilvae]